MTSKAATGNGLSKQEAKYRNLVADCLREFKTVQKGIRRQQAKAERLRASSRRPKLRNTFRPFAIELSSGRRYVVPHPEFIMVGRTVVVVMGADESVTTIDP